MHFIGQTEVLVFTKYDFMKFVEEMACGEFEDVRSDVMAISRLFVVIV